MALESRLELRLSQKLILTPQLQQAIKLLQLSQLELVEAIEQELEDNPVDNIIFHHVLDECQNKAIEKRTQ